MNFNFLKKVYLIGWFLAISWSIYSLPSIFSGKCKFQTVQWLACKAAVSDSAGFGLAIFYLLFFLVLAGYAWKNWHNFGVLSAQKNVFRKLLVISCFFAVLVVPLGTSDLPYYFSAGDSLNQGINIYHEPWVHHVDYADPALRLNLNGFSYGPAIALLLQLFFRISGGNYLVFIFFWKLLMVATIYLASFITIKIIKLLNKDSDGKALFFLGATQPMIIFEWVVNGHFDGLWILTVLLAVYSSIKKHWFPVLPLLMLGTWVKYLPVLLLPFFVLWWWQDLNRGSWKKNSIEMCAGLAASVLLTFLLWQPFWSGSKVFDSLVIQSKWAVTSIFAVVYYSLKPFFVWLLAGRAHLVLTSLAQGGLLIFTIYLLLPLVKKSLMIIFKKETWNDVEFIRAITIFLLVYLVFWQKSFWPWYGSWFIYFGIILFAVVREKIMSKIIIWLSSVPFMHHIILLTDAVFRDPNAGSQLWFFWAIVTVVLGYPLIQLILWRRTGFEHEKMA